MPFVALDRTFIPWNEKNEPGSESYESFGVLYGGLSWKDLLEKPRVVVLAEAGSGKTSELKEQARLCGLEGKLGFYATVQDVATEGLEGALSAADRRSLEAWRGAGEKAWFFIDSVDEAKLDGTRLHRALRKLADGISHSPARAHIVLSGRITDWEFRSDLEQLQEWLPVPAPIETLIKAPPPTISRVLRGELQRPSKPEAESPLVVLMAAFREPTVRAFAAANGIDQLDAFIAAIEEGDLWTFARRPLDLNWLVAYWKDFGRFGTLAAMIEKSLSQRLVETNPDNARKDTITREGAFPAIERVGASMVFGRVSKVSIPDSSLSLDAARPEIALDDVLPDWTADNRRQLLTRPVFDPATFGHVRLHNDNDGAVSAFLAARWLGRRRSENCPVPELLALLFGEQYGIRLIKPSLRQTAAWLAISDPDVAREVVSREPFLLLSSGDPASLPLDVRRAALAQVVTGLHVIGKQMYVADEPLRRFAVPELSGEVRQIWNQMKDSWPVRELLLRLIGLGRLTDCADIAVEVAFGDAAEPTALVYAGRALVSVCDEGTIQRYTRHVLDHATSLPEYVLWSALDLVFLRGVSVSEFLGVLETMDPAVRDGSLGLEHYGPRFAKRITKQVQLEELLTGLMRLLGQASQDISAEETAAEKSYTPAISATALRILQGVSLEAAPDIAIAATLRLAEGERHRLTADTRELMKEVNKSPARRRAALWQAERQFRHHTILRGQPLVDIYQMQILGWLPSLLIADLDWLLADVDDPAVCRSEDQKRLAIAGAVDIWQKNDRADALMDRIHQVSDKTPALAAVINFWRTPRVKSEDDLRYEALIAANKAARELQDRQQDERWSAFIEPLKAAPDQLRHLPAPTVDSIDPRLFYLWELLQSIEDSRTRYALDDVSPLEPLVGKELTAAFRDGLVSFWRQWEPTLESSRPADKRNQVSKIDCMGIASISVEARSNPNWAESLSAAEARRAAAYATIEMNGFPVWLTQLAAAWPDDVGAVLAGDIIVELDDPTEGAHRGTLQKVEYAKQEIARVVAPLLLPSLHTRPNMPTGALDSVLTVLGRGLSVVSAGFIDLMLQRASEAADLGVAGCCFAALFRCDPGAAVVALSARLDGLAFSGQRLLVECLLPRLFGDGFRSGDVAPDLPLKVLERLMVIAFQTVRIEDDIERESGAVFSPNDRDSAQWARGRVFNALVAIPGRATVEALARLKLVPGFPVDPKRLDEHIFARAAEDAEHSPWSAGEAYEMEKEFDNQPNTAADLQKVALRRLGEIQHALVHSDFAQGKTLKAMDQEVDVQVWVASELRSCQRRAYSVEREPHVAEEKEPDIRLRCRSTDASLPIEIKLVKDWTLVQLEAALTAQLCGRYLRARGGRHGLLLLVHLRPRRLGWRTADGTYLSFPEVISHLQAMADAIAAGESDAPQVRIVVLDVSSVAGRKSKKSGAATAPEIDN